MYTTCIRLSSVWLNPSIKINGKVVLNEKLLGNIFFVNEKMETNGNGGEACFEI
jgi:hypothetical protein